MANNFSTNAGAGGNTFASDDVAGIHYPYTKLVFGPDDTATIVTASVGLPVQLITLTAPLNVTGGGAEATALRVTIANDSTGVLSVDDNGGSLTVDGTVAFSNTTIAVTNVGTFAVQAEQSGTWTVQPGNTANTTPWLMSIHDGTTKATVRDLAANDALNVAIVDGSGNQITSFVTQYAEDSVHASGDSVTMAGVVQQAADAALAGDGDRTCLQVDANGYLKVNIKAGAGSGGTSATDDAAFTAGSGSGTPMMGFVTADTVDAGDVGVLAMLANRQLKVTLYDSAGAELSVGGGTQYDEDTVHVSGDKVTMAGVVQQTADAALSSASGDRSVLQVDATGWLKSNVKDVTPGFGASNLGKRTDDPATTSDVGVALLAKRTGTPANFSSADGDYEPLQISAGRLHTSTLASGSQSHDAVDSGAPVKVGGYASSTAPTAVSANGDRVNAWYDLNGRAVVLIESALPAGTNNIGDVDVLTVPTDPFGANADAASATGSISAKLRFIASTGIPITGTVTVGSHAVTNAGTFAVQDSEKVADDAAFTVATTKVMPAGFLADETSTDSVDEGDAGAARMTLDRKQVVAQYAHTAGGVLVNSQLSTAAVISTSVKASPGQVYAVHCFNNGANEVFLRLYNQTGAPAGGDNANIIYRAIIPGNTAGAGAVANIPPGLEFSTGIGVRVTGAVADTDTTALAANEVILNVLYR